MTSFLNGKVAIAGIGQTKFSKASGKSDTTLAVEAIKAAIVDAGLTPADIHGVTRYTMDTTNEADVIKNLGIPELRFYSAVEYGGMATAGILLHAAMAIATGQADAVVTFRSLNGRSGMRLGRGERHAAPSSTATYVDSERVPGGAMASPYGLMAPAQAMAMWTRRYMHQYGVSEEDMTDYLAEVCIRQRRYAGTNPNAVMRDVPLDRDGYVNSRMIAEPLRLFDICLETDGACAMVLVSVERARDLPNKPVYIMSADQSLAPWYGNNFNFYRDDFGRLAPRTSSERLFGRAGVKPSDIDVAAIYEASSYQVLATLETTGFCDWGEGGAFYKSGALPINTHGGHLSEAYIHGQNHFNEAVRQLRGTAANQVEGAEIALVTNAGWSSAILRN